MRILERLMYIAGTAEFVVLCILLVLFLALCAWCRHVSRHNPRLSASIDEGNRQFWAWYLGRGDDD